MYNIQVSILTVSVVLFFRRPSIKRGRGGGQQRHSLLFCTACMCMCMFKAKTKREKIRKSARNREKRGSEEGGAEMESK